MPDYPQVGYQLRYCDTYGHLSGNDARLMSLESCESLLRMWAPNADRKLTKTKAMPKVHIVRVTVELVEAFEFTKDAEQ